MDFKEFYLFREANVLRPSTKNTFVYPDDRQPLKDSDTIRVYHGFHDLSEIIKATVNGLSGKERAARRYSYEFNNNPKGLFVTISLDIAKDFGNYIAEIHTRVSDLEAPVWPGGGYTVQGQMEKYFKDDNDREDARLQRRSTSSKSKYDSIKNSDRPELAELLYNSYEQQALFTGELNKNSIRAIWINTTPQKSGKYSTYKRLSVPEFIKEYSGQMTDARFTNTRVLQPRDKFELNDFLEKIIKQSFDPKINPKYRMTKEELIDIFVGMKDSDNQLLHYVWPNQLKDFKAALNNIK